MNTLKLAIAVLSAALLACAGGASDSTITAPPSGANKPGAQMKPTENPTEQPETPGEVCDQGTVYKGFGGRVLVAGRVEAEQNTDRARIKPYSALTGEYERVLGKTPSLLNQLGATFNQPPKRWYEEPQASAVSLYSAFRVAFVGCLDLTKDDPAYANTPDAASAEAVCSALGRRFWSRTPQASELDACVTVATVDTQKETNPRRRWAYTCASLLSSAGFITW